MIGIEYADMMKMTLHEINVLGEGFIEKQRKKTNDMLYQIHQQALMNSLAIWGSKSFPREPRRVDKPSSGEYHKNEVNSLDSLHNLARMLTSHVPSKANHPK